MSFEALRVGMAGDSSIEVTKYQTAKSAVGFVLIRCYVRRRIQPNHCRLGRAALGLGLSQGPRHGVS